MPSLFLLPNEILTSVLRRLGDTNPYTDTKAARHSCKLFYELGERIAFQSIALVADRGTEPIRRHLEFFEENKRKAGMVEELSITGRSTDIAINLEGCFVVGAEDVAQIAGTFLQLRRLRLARGFVRGGYGRGPLPEYKQLTTLELHDTTLLTDAPFPENLIWHLKSIKKTSVSFAPATIVEREVTDNLALTRLPLTSLSFPTSMPFASSFISSSIIAAPDVEYVYLEVPALVLPPYFTELPDLIDLGAASELKHAKVLMPTVNFANTAAAEITWTYTGGVLETIAKDIPKITIAFDCGDIEWANPYPRLAAFPVDMLIDLVDSLSAETEVHIILQAPAGATMPAWESVMDLNEEWDLLAQRPRVTFSEVLDTVDYSPFSLHDQFDDEFQDDTFMWWNEDE